MAFDPSGLTAAQKQVAQRIIDIGVELGASQRDIGIALATAKRESDLTNDKTPDKYGSVGIFQGRADDARGSNGEKWGYGTIAEITAGDGDNSIRTFYLGANTNGSGAGYNAGLLANKDRDEQSWPLAAWKTNGYYSAPNGQFGEGSGNSPFYAKDSENGQFAVAALAGTINGIDSSTTQGIPQAGGALYSRQEVGQVIRHPTAPPPPTSTPTPTANSTAPPTTPYTAAAIAHNQNPLTAIGTGAQVVGHAIANSPTVRGAEVIGHAIAGAPVIGDAMHAFGGAAKDYYTAPVHAVESLAHGVGNVASGIGHAVSGLFGGGSSKPSVGPPTAPGINWANVPEGAKVTQQGPSVSNYQGTANIRQMEQGGGSEYNVTGPHAGGSAPTAPSNPAGDIGTFGGVTNVRQLEQGNAFLPQQSQADFANRSLPLNGIVPSPTSGPLGPAGQEMNNLRDAIAQQAHNWLGIDYVFGGKDASADGGIDCSGLVTGLLRAVGIDAGDPENTNAADLGRMGPLTSNPQVGDLVAWDNSSRNAGADHIAFYLGNGYIAEAPRTGVKSRIRKLTDKEMGKMWFVDMTKYEGKGTVPPEHIPNHEIRPQSVLPVQAVKDIGHLAAAALHGVEKLPVVGGAIKDVAGAVGTAGHVVAGDVGSFVHASENALQDAAGTVGHAVGHGAEALGSSIAHGAGAVGTTIGHGAEAFGSDIGHAAGAVGSTIGHGAEAIGSTIGHIATDEAHVLGGVAGDIAHGVGDAASAYAHQVGGGIADVAQHPLDALKGAGQFIGTGVADKALGRLGVAPYETANAIAKGVVEPALGAVGHAVGSVAGKIGGLFGGHPDAPPVVVNSGGGVPQTTQQRLSGAQADIGLANRAEDMALAQAVAARNQQASTPSGGYQGTTNARALEQQSNAEAIYGGANLRALEQQGAQQEQPWAVVAKTAGNSWTAYNAWAAANPKTAAADAAAVAWAASISTPPPIFHPITPITPITHIYSDSSNAYYANAAANQLAAKRAGVAPPAYHPISASTPYAGSQAAAYTANSAARSGTPIGGESAYRTASGNYGVSTPSTQAMSTGVDRYSDARDYYYSGAGGGGATAASVATQMMHPNVRSDAYDTYQRQLDQQRATQAAINQLGREKGFGGGSSGMSF